MTVGGQQAAGLRCPIAYFLPPYFNVPYIHTSSFSVCLAGQAAEIKKTGAFESSTETGKYIFFIHKNYFDVLIVFEDKVNLTASKGDEVKLFNGKYGN